MQTVRSLHRALSALTAALLMAGGSLAAVVPVARASTSHIQPLAISITGMTPTTAGPKSTVTLYGTLANHTGSPLTGVAVQASTSTAGFTSPSQMSEFTSDLSTGASPLSLDQAGTPYQVASPVPNGATVRWTVSFRAGAFYDQFGQFGVFPVQVQVQAAGTSDTAAARTFLPFWPGGSAATQPAGLQAAWVWPLVDTPQQGACPQTLATPALAGTVAPGGRLSTLLDAGAAWARTDRLTWDIDPALLSDVSVMTKQYFTQGNACTDRFSHEPSAAAGKWLSQLRTSTAGEPAFLTPYANVDVAALSHSGLDNDLKAAYRVGDTVAGQILPNTFGINGTGTGDGEVLSAAWPADGRADAGVLTSLAGDGINTVVLSSDEPPFSSTGSFAEDALARTVSGAGTSMSVLVANSRITSLLGTASASASEAGTFTFSQDFLAQTAMIAAELPSRERSLVMAPPTGWDPSTAEAKAVLSITQSAPWLHPVGLSTLAAAAGKLPSTTRLLPKQVSGSELSEAYLDNLAPVRANLSLFKELLYQPPASVLDPLNAALATVESSAWRGPGSPGGWLAMSQLSTYLSDSEHKVQMIVSQKVLLTGKSGDTPVSVQNGLGWPIQVQVAASTPLGSQLQVGTANAHLTVQPHGSDTGHVRITSATIGTTTMRLQLVTQDGSPLRWTSKSLSVEVTRFGRLLLILIGGAIGILVLTSAFRLRRRRLADAENNSSDDATVDAGGAG